jgi:hypothetical protein
VQILSVYGIIDTPTKHTRKDMKKLKYYSSLIAFTVTSITTLSIFVFLLIRYILLDSMIPYAGYPTQLIDVFNPFYGMDTIIPFIGMIIYFVKISWYWLLALWAGVFITSKTKELSERLKVVVSCSENS